MTGKLSSTNTKNFVKKIFACDIDGTIYFDNTNQIDLLYSISALSKSWIIVFNTSRSLAEFLKLGITLDVQGYAIVDTGRSIYRYSDNNHIELDCKWDKRCKEININTQLVKEVLLSYEFIKNVKIVYPWYIHIDFANKISLDEEALLSELSESNGYTFSWDRNYIGKILHNDISKKAALNYISDETGYELFLGAGNNMVDLPFVELCKTKIMVTPKSNIVPSDYIQVNPGENAYKEIFRILGEKEL